MTDIRQTLVKALQHHSVGKLKEAERLYRQILAKEPRHAEALRGLGKALQRQERLEEAAACYRQALAVEPDSAEAHNNLGNALARQSEPEEATAHYRRALELKPTDGLRIKTALTLPVIPLSCAHLADARRGFRENITALAAQPLSLKNPAVEVGMTTFRLPYHGLNDRELQVQMASLYLKACPSLSFSAPHCTGPPRRAPGGRIKVGFLSRFFTHHTIGKLTRGFIAELPRERFAVTVFTFPQRSDASWEFIRSRADETVTLPSNLDAARRAVAAKELDVLLYSEIGMDPLTYFLAFSRLAPVQCVTWGHPVTTGIPAIDNFISSEGLEPDDAESHYSERLVRLKHLPTYYYSLKVSIPRKSRKDFGLSGHGALYLCPQSLFKLHPEFDEVLGALLRTDTAGVLILIEGNEAHWTELMRRRFRATMPDVVERVRFLPKQSGMDFMSLLALVDVILDPLHWSGGNTTLEALWLGTPIVTLPGAFMRGRVTYACYRQMGLTDCVAATKEDYVAKAVRLAKDREYRESVKKRILAAKDVLFENREAVRDLERFFLHAVETAQRRQNPR